MAEQKDHKVEEPNKKEKTPQEKKIRDLRASGFSINEISEKLKIPRSVAEKPFSDDLANIKKGKTSKELQKEQDDREERSLQRGMDQQEAKAKAFEDAEAKQAADEAEKNKGTE